jgi:hypothetical protein
MRLDLDLERVRDNVRRATTEDLLDRATVYREGMEPEALAVIDAELRQRGLTECDIAEHAERRRGRVLFSPEGWALKCARCYRPAVAQVWGWHWLLGVLPLFPRWFPYCEDHLPRPLGERASAPCSDHPAQR